MKPRTLSNIYRSLNSSNSNYRFPRFSPEFQLFTLVAATTLFLSLIKGADAWPWNTHTPPPILSVPMEVHGTNYLFETLESYLASCLASAITHGYGDVLKSNGTFDYVVFHDNGDDKLFRDRSKPVHEVFQNYIVGLYETCLDKFKSNNNKIAGITIGATFGGIILLLALVCIPFYIAFRRRHQHNNAHLAELPVFQAVVPQAIAPQANVVGNVNAAEQVHEERDLEKQVPTEGLNTFSLTNK